MNVASMGVSPDFLQAFLSTYTGRKPDSTTRPGSLLGARQPAPLGRPAVGTPLLSAAGTDPLGRPTLSPRPRQEPVRPERNHPEHSRRSEHRPQRFREKLDFRAVNVSRETAATLEIVTDEGDRVTISRSTDIDVSYASLRYKSKGPDGKTSVKAEAREIQIDSSFSLSVEGDLNEQELADIQKLLDRLRPGMDEGTAEAGPTPVDGSEFGSLAGYELTLEQSVSVNVLHVRRKATMEALDRQDSERESDTQEIPSDGDRDDTLNLASRTLETLKDFLTRSRESLAPETSDSSFDRVLG